MPGPVRHIGIPVTLLQAKCDELRRHVVESDCAVMHLSAVARILGE